MLLRFIGRENPRSLRCLWLYYSDKFKVLKKQMSAGSWLLTLVASSLIRDQGWRQVSIVDPLALLFAMSFRFDRSQSLSQVLETLSDFQRVFLTLTCGCEEQGGWILENLLKAACISVKVTDIWQGRIAVRYWQWTQALQKQKFWIVLNY